ncbi:DUF4905 domain-containing protein [Marinoscillum sp. MHG1-6]|uniref:DUF4905 domain-containing protein n=1 Tax=Marinoscillum sp. MHG1-6 TaxID=2959627 RepID=UPI00215854F0|nr:DUF4905 domain-containing protein [Marinoscillum sp. MHG1-6]
MEHHLSFDFSFDIVGKIWQLKADHKNGQLALEVRNEEDQSVSFLVFDLETFEISDYLNIEVIDWWSTLHGIQSGDLAIIQYSDPQDPSKKTYLSYNCETQRLTQSDDGFIESEDSGGMAPVFAPMGSEIFELCKEYLEEDIQLGVEYYEEGSTIIFSYYLRSGAKFDRYLLVNKDGEEILRAVQDTGLDGYASGGFLIQSGFLIFIADSKQVNGIKI